MKRLLSLISVLLILGSLSASPSFKPFVETEQGAISIVHHTYENKSNKSDPSVQFDYIQQGGQELLYPFSRYAIGATFNDRHRVWFTYQPLTLVTNVEFKEDVYIGTETFTAGTAMELTYSFPFYRATYTYDLLKNNDNAVLGVGLAMQIRNASIRFVAIDGSNAYVTQNIGLVPALALYSEYRVSPNLVLSADIVGSYASSAFFNGADFDFSGSLLDASLRMTYELKQGFDLFGTMRFFGGTSDGTSTAGGESWTESTDKYTQNNIASLTFSAGASWKLR